MVKDQNAGNKRHAVGSIPTLRNQVNIMHTATLLVMRNEVQRLHPANVDLLNPDPRHRQYIYKHEYQFEDIRDAEATLAMMYAEAFFEGWSANDYSLALIDGQPSAIPVNMWSFTDVRFVQAYSN